ncbi:MAG: ABC transporter ATP-binding protein [Microbacteriaceae bacterium]
MLNAVRRAFRFLTRRERIAYVVIVATKMLTGVLDVVGILLIGLIASAVATQVAADPDAARPTLFGIQLPELEGEGLLAVVSVVLAVFVVKAVIAVSLTRAQTQFVARVETRAAERIAERLIRARLDDLKRFSKAEMEFAVTGSSTYAFTGLLNQVGTLLSESFLLVLVVVTLFVVDPATALFAFLYFAVFVVVVQLLISRSLRRSGREAVEGTVNTLSSLGDSIDAFREIAVMGKQQHFIDRVSSQRRRISSSGATMTFLQSMPRYVVETALILGVVILVGQLLLSGQFASGFAVVGVFLTGGVRLMASLLPLQSAIANLKQNTEQAQTALDLLDEMRERLEAGERAGAASVDTAAAAGIDPDAALAVDVDAVSYRHTRNSDTPTLDRVSLTIPAGAYAAIVGPSGAGKTTLVDLVLGLSDPESGTLRLSGVAPAALRAAHPELVSYVPQKPGLVSGSIAENVALGIAPELIDRDRVHEVLRQAFLAEFVERLPEGIDTSVGKQADDLSGGQIQRIGVARALYPRPRLLVMDEATSALDASSEAFIAETLAALHGEVTVIVVAHRLSTVQRADVVHVLEAGRLTASGDFAEVSAANPTVAEYVRLMTFDER